MSEHLAPLAVPHGARPATGRSHLGLETVALLAICLGQSAVYSVLSLLDKLTAGPPLNQQVTTMNNSVTPERPWLDLAYKLTDYLFLAAPVPLALYLLMNVRPPGRPPWRAIGLDAHRLGRDGLMGLAITAAIGIPGLGLYFASRSLGINTTVAPANLSAHWWTVPLYVLAAFANGLLEEVVMIGYLLTRWRQCGWDPRAASVVSALIRGSYHLYQGFGGFLGNVVMGLAFGWYWQRTRRLWPLVVAHTLLDVFSFVGYALLKSHLPGL
ncbi:CAAX protease self-immunity [Propionibacterium cyclohexanicum]|uniref:CAAX protease self-immunity n=1 Tax=Propionibacterium cyclohexanicum TaxID=64702 RepID=A0A1H9RTH7_9ACTN|nr:CPBP family intramembrane glutamic endopeptidase [Propionibacterium cyclohexanicum]SER76150.1 CAAX protease self-immunity [Propionibacterium cyclohexanicum]